MAAESRPIIQMRSYIDTSNKDIILKINNIGGPLYKMKVQIKSRLVLDAYNYMFSSNDFKKYIKNGEAGGYLQISLEDIFGEPEPTGALKDTVYVIRSAGLIDLLWKMGGDFYYKIDDNTNLTAVPAQIIFCMRMNFSDILLNTYVESYCSRIIRKGPNYNPVPPGFSRETHEYKVEPFTPKDNDLVQKFIIETQNENTYLICSNQITMTEKKAWLQNYLYIIIIS